MGGWRRVLAREAAAAIVGLLATVAAGLAQEGKQTSLSCPDRRGSIALSGWDIVEGDPQGDAILAPDTSRRHGGVFVNRWDLRPYAASRLFLRCEYGGAPSDRLVLPMKGDVRGCEARGKAGMDGNVILPMKVGCR